MEGRTLISVGIRKRNYTSLQFLEVVDGFDHFSIVKDIEDTAGYIEIDYFYNEKFGWWQRRCIKKNIRKRHGYVIDFTPLHKSPPLISARAKSGILSSLLIFITTYLSGLIGLPNVSSHIGVNMGYQESWILALISAIIAGITRFANVFNISLKDQ